ncbi:MAG TPA: hypothetical protein PLN96_17445 [Zoogloea sp.]|uniref:hypothetical protein n=1 Tax=Zoogloea sp. TaxID=49181 RepID=UPI002B6813F6|nr:hypothetical protein [Zoogloea sp.]HNI49661.1 hypothetical protein [Zoogloea sp.]
MDCAVSTQQRQTVGLSLAHSDPTQTVDLQSPDSALGAIDQILARRYGAGYGRPLLEHAVADVARAFRGDYPGLLRCDTHYHDLRHALDAGLAMARLIDGHCMAVAADDPGRLDATHALLGVLLTLYHDIGLLRKPDEADLEGASLTPIHERRGVHFMHAYLKNTPLAALSDRAELIMITRLDFKMRRDWQGPDRTIARLMGAADLMSQLSDRCYLEKCRDFLFVEFSAIGLTGPGNPYPDRETLLRKTPAFYTGLLRRRIHDEYDDSDRYMAVHFGGVCPYTAAIERNFGYLQGILDAEDFSQLRRTPQRIIDSRL